VNQNGIAGKIAAMRDIGQIAHVVCPKTTDQVCTVNRIDSDGVSQIGKAINYATSNGYAIYSEMAIKYLESLKYLIILKYQAVNGIYDLWVLNVTSNSLVKSGVVHLPNIYTNYFC
jgi:hypothetical protein